MGKNIDMEHITEQDLMREFMEVVSEGLRDNEITVNMYMEHMGATRNVARHKLSMLEGKGILKKRKVVVDSTLMNAYSPRHGTWKDVIDQIKQE